MSDQDPAFARAFDLQRQGRLQEAAAGYAAILKHNPKHFGALHYLGLIHHLAGQNEQAIDHLGKALRLQRDAEALNTFGLASAALGRTDEALGAFNEAIALNSAYAVAYYNRGNAFRDRGEDAAALADFAAAIARAPDLAEPHWNTGTLRLHRGEFALGWPEFEWRFKTHANSAYARDLPATLWSGQENLDGRTILIHAEQGLGDTIQFCRYVPMVAAQGATVVFEIQQPLIALMKNLQGADHLVARGERLPDFDYQCPLLGLPLRFDTRLETIPADVPYLEADADKAARLGSALALRTDALRVGLVWSGNAAHDNDRNRSIALDRLLKALPDGPQYVSLQKDLRAADAGTLRANPAVRDAAPLLQDFSDTAAVISLLDVVIAVDTSVAHLAGALAKPTWVLLPHVSDWRWLRERNDSPWYPTMRLFRQPRSGDWDTPLAALRTALSDTKKPTHR